MYFTVDGLTTTTLPLPATTTTQRPAGTSQTNLNTIQAPELEEPAVVGCKLEGETHAIGTEALLKCPDGFYFPDLLQNLTVVCANDTENSIQWSPNIPECLATEDQLGLPLEMMIFSLFFKDLIDYYKHVSLCCFGGFFTSSGVVTVILGYNIFQIVKLQFMLISCSVWINCSLILIELCMELNKQGLKLL